jgi:hypothetical protein
MIDEPIERTPIDMHAERATDESIKKVRRIKKGMLCNGQQSFHPDQLHSTPI